MAKYYSEPLAAYPDYLANAQAVPQNTSADGNGGAQRIGLVNGKLEVIANVTTEITLADTTSITVKLQSSDTENGTYADVYTLYTATASGATTIPVDTFLGSYTVDPLSDKLWFKVVIETTDAAAAGAVSVFPRMLV